MAATQERRTRMVTSSVNQPLKKGGAGAYGWGAPGSVTDFVSTPVMQSSVTVAAAPQVFTQAAPAMPFTGSLGTSAFPSFGSTVVSSGATSGAWAAGSSSLFQRAAQPVSVPTQSFGTATYNLGSTYDPKPIKMASRGYVGEQDRRSRMATSTVKAVEKKGGAGTGNWGVATEIGYACSTPVFESKVAIGSAPVMTQTIVSSPYGGSLANTQQFPALGSQTIGTRTVSSPTAAGWNIVPETVKAQTPECAKEEAEAKKKKEAASPKKEEAKEGEATDEAGKKKDCVVM